MGLRYDNDAWVLNRAFPIIQYSVHKNKNNNHYNNNNDKVTKLDYWGFIIHEEIDDDKPATKKSKEILKKWKNSPKLKLKLQDKAICHYEPENEEQKDHFFQFNFYLKVIYNLNFSKILRLIDLIILNGPIIYYKLAIFVLIQLKDYWMGIYPHKEFFLFESLFTSFRTCNVKFDDDLFVNSLLDIPITLPLIDQIKSNIDPNLQ